MKKQLTLIRHAKSSWKNPTLGDLDRPLNKRGEKAAPDMGTRIAKRGIHFDLVLCSPAKRTRATIAHMLDAMQADKRVVEIYEPLYTFDANVLHDIIQNLPDTAQSVALVGHNPALTDAANELCSTQISNIPTAGIAHIHFSCEWHAIGAGAGKLVWFDFPKNTHPAKP